MNDEVYAMCKEVYGLTHRQAEVVTYKAIGVDNDTIMEKLGCTKMSIDHAMRVVKKKVGAPNSDALFFQLGTKLG